MGPHMPFSDLGRVGVRSNFRPFLHGKVRSDKSTRIARGAFNFYSGLFEMRPMFARDASADLIAHSQNKCRVLKAVKLFGVQ